MATTNVGILTVAGKNLVDRVNAGSTKISYTKVVLSSMDNSALTDAQLAALIDVTPQEVMVSNPDTILDTNNGETKIRGNGDNTGLTTGVYIKTYAVYAKDDAGKEILYGITISDHPNYLAPFDGLTPQAITYTYRTKISQTSNINFTNSTDVYVSDQDLKDAISVLVTETDFTDKLATKEDKLNYVPADDNKVVHTIDTTDWQKQKVTTDSGDAQIIVTKQNGKNFNEELLALNGIATVYVENGALSSPMPAHDLRGLANVFTRTGYVILSTHGNPDIQMIRGVIQANGAIEWKRLVDDNNDGTITVNGNQFTPADVAKSVQVANSVNWQKRKITTDSGSMTNSVVVGETVSTKIFAADAGVTTWYIQAGANGNQSSDSMRGQLFKDTSGFGGGFFVSNDGTQWRLLVTSNNVVNWQRLPNVTGGNNFDQSSNINDIYLQKNSMWIADVLSDYRDTFRKRFMWQFINVCPSGTSMGMYLRTDSVPTGMSIVRDGNTSINWFIIKESSIWVYGFAVSGGQNLHTLEINNGVYSTAALPGSLKDLNNTINSKATIQSDGRSIANYPMVQRDTITTSRDLNGLTTNGLYPYQGVNFSSGPSDLSSGTNYGYIEVYNAAGVIYQTIHSYNQSIDKVYRRTYGGSPASWGKWIVNAVNPAS